MVPRCAAPGRGARPTPGAVRVCERAPWVPDGVSSERTTGDVPDGADPFNLRVEPDQGGGWCVVRNVDGRRHVVSRHRDEAQATAAAASINDTSRNDIVGPRRNESSPGE